MRGGEAGRGRLFPGAAAILADLDGCLVSGGAALPGAAAFAAAAGPRLWIVSNNSSDSEATLADRLARLDVAVPPERMALAGAQTLRRLAAARPGARVALFAAPPLHGLAEALGLRLDAERADIAILARDPGFDLAALTRLLALLHRGAALIATNTDQAHPGPGGAPAPETGALLAAVRAARPGTRARSLGKPAPDLLRLAIASANAAPEACVFVGDNAATDGRAAAAAGVAFIRVDPASGTAPLLTEAA
ncbi:MAG: HAD family hydrolase [Rubrimonas sp.]